MTTEQLAALKEVADGFVVERAVGPDKYGVTIAQVSGHNGAHIAAFDPTTCKQLVEEVERLQTENARMDEMMLALCQSKAKESK
jgi:hypothetical protein